MLDNSFTDPQLPENHSLKDINKYKRQINWGELPPFYHMVASSVSEFESQHSMGFDNPLNKICKPTNWNLELLEGYRDEYNQIHVKHKPRISIHQVITDRGFELHCFPLVKNKELDQYVKGHRMVEFEVWDPGTMKVLGRINQLHKFIEYYFQSGDKADKALIFYAMRAVETLIEYMRKHVDVVKVDGTNIQQVYKHYEKQQLDLDIDDLNFR